MTSLLNKPMPWGERRHTTDHTARSTANTPSVSRSSSVASDASHLSEPSWFSAYNGQDTSRKNSSATTASQKSSEDKPKSKSGFSSWLNDDPQVRKQMKQHKEAEKKRRNEEKRKQIDKLVITSKHAAAVRAKLASDPNYRRGSSDSSSGVSLGGNQSSAHISAAQQEMRFPHSGPPALHGGHKGKAGKHDADMPALTRIVSGDEKDEEEDHHMQKRREEWIRKQRPDIGMRHLSEVKTPEDEEELAELLDNTVLDVDGTRVVGVDLEGEQYTPKPYKERHGKAGFQKAEDGKWTKPREGPYILHNV